MKRQGHTLRKGQKVKGIMFEEKLSWRKGSKQILGFGVWKSQGLGQPRCGQWKPIWSTSQAQVERAWVMSQILEVVSVQVRLF